MYRTDATYDHFAKVYGESLADAQALPQNTTWNGDPVKLNTGMGSFEIVCRVHGAVTLADTKTLTIKLQHAGSDLSYSDLATLYSITSSGGT